MSPNSPDASQPDVGVVIPAGGRGERLGGGVPKQFRPLAGVPMLLRAVRPFTQVPDVCEIIIPLPSDTLATPPAWLAEAAAGAMVRLVEGGATRADSVANGVRALGPDCRIVLIHDAARPLVSVDTVRAVIDEVRRGHCAIAASRTTDTLKRSDPAGARVLETIDRSTVWRAQTPQGFPRDLLLRAYDMVRGTFGDAPPTDEATLMEAAGFEVALVPDTPWNLKVTTDQDLMVAERLAAT